MVTLVTLVTINDINELQNVLGHKLGHAARSQTILVYIVQNKC